MISPFNDEQLEAITTRNTTILVSAPAGSGKTKILVSRIMSLLMEDHYHIDQFLVLTFTEAAAAEMKQRLLLSIDEKLAEELPHDVYAHLLIQKQKVPYAYITNFHGFCSQLLKKYGYLVGVEGDFEILSDPLILKHQVLDQCIEYWMADDHIKQFVQLNFNDMNYRAFKTMILELYEMMHSIDDINGFVDNIKQNIYLKYIENNDLLDQWEVFSEIKRQLRLSAIEGYNQTVELEEYASKYGINDYFDRPDEQTKTNAALPVPAENNHDYYMNILKMFNQDYLAYETFKQTSLTPLPKSYNLKWDETIKPYQAEFNKIKSKMSKTYYDKAQQYLVDDESKFKQALFESYRIIDQLLSEDGLVIRFKQEYQKAKALNQQLDFNDLEQFTIALLQPENKISELLYHQLKEIMIDEYQDTNSIQERIISLIKDYQKPSIVAFMVGDMKQSIYRFRQADPLLFKEKYDTYNHTPQCKRIDLRFNYRSNKIVLDSVNYIFNQIMDSDVGGLEYLHDISSHLNYDYLRKEGCKSYEELPLITKKTDEYYANENRFDSEVLLVNKESQGDLSDGEYEAHLVALKIKDLMENSTINTFTKDHRAINYKDIVVLMRSTGLFLTFKKVFDQYGIPNHIVLSQGYLNATEIVAVITMIKAIINQFDDISMLSLVRGYYLFSHFDENLISQIRLFNTECSLYENMLLYVENGLDQTNVIKNFIECYEQLKSNLLTMSPSEFLINLYQQSGYDSFVLGLINGTQRKANLDLLVEEFRNLETQMSIFEIVEQYTSLMEYQSSRSPAQVISSSDNVVQFMTIHKSKGLEFPIVFVSNMDKTFNKQDSTKRMIIDKQLGIAIKPRTYMNIELGGQMIYDQIVEYENPYRKLLAARQTSEAIDEEMRIFYVALTRASQKLIMTGVSSINDVEKWQQKVIVNENPEIYDGLKNEHILMYYNARKVNTYLDWVGTSLMRHPQVITQWLDLETSPTIQQNFKTIQSFKSTQNYCFKNTKASKFTLNYFNKEELDLKIKENIQPYDHSKQFEEVTFNTLPDYPLISETIAVTQLHKDDEAYIFNQKAVSQALTPAQKGTLVHAFLEYLPLETIEIRKIIDDLYNAGLYNEIERDVLYEYEHQLNMLIQSDCFNIMKNATHIYREKNFSLLDSQTKQIIHGIFDVLCFNENKIIIIDYKTDRLKMNTPIEILKQKHHTQMSYYKQIIQNLYPDYSVEAMVYYLELGKSVTI